MSMRNIIKYRYIWMAVAIAWTMFMHGNFRVDDGTLLTIKGLGYGGVDIFIFASGIGCFYSLEKDGDSFNFLKRRVLRIIPTYWIFMIGWSVYKRKFIGMSAIGILGNFLCVRNFIGMGEDFNWYISAMWLTYLLAPFFKGIADRTNSVFKFLLFNGFLIIFSVCFWDCYTFIITMTRLPLFFIGMCVGKMAWNDVRISKLWILWAWIFMEVGARLYFHWSYVHPSELWLRGYFWYPFILITPGLCVLISCLMELIKKVLGKAGECAEKVLELPGKFSFELYLLHVWLFDVINNNWIPAGKVQDVTKTWILAVIVLIPACLVLRGMANGVTYVIKNVGNFFQKNKFFY